MNLWCGLFLVLGTFVASVAGDAAAVGVVFATRNDVKPGAYDDLIDAIHRENGMGDVIVKTINAKHESDIGTAVEGLNSEGVKSIFVAGHSMSNGGVVAQNWVKDNENKVEGLILLAAFLQRTHRPDIVQCLSTHVVQPKKSLKYPLGHLEDGVHDCVGSNTVVFPVPTLTLGGELDGVVRVGRFAEAYYSQTVVSQLSSSEFPVVVVRGLNHAGMLSEKKAELPRAVGNVDLDVGTSDGGLEAVAHAVAAFIQVHSSAVVSDNGGSAALFLDSATVQTSKLVDPLVSAAVELENNWFFTGADDEHGGSSWAAMAQQMMAEPLPQNYTWTVANEFHLLSDEDKIPPYYRDKHRAQVTLSPDGKSLSSTTVAQLRFIEISVTEAGIGLNGGAIIKEEKQGILDIVKDDGSAPVSALEIGTKLMSRQKVFNVTGVVDAPASLDDGDRCKPINQAAYDWALAHVSEEARERFEAYGTPMRMMSDKKPTPPAGPWWIWTYMKQEMAKDESALEVTSFYAFYSLSADPYGAGNHYCKLLSPARAVEWILTDGLRSTKKK